MNKEKNNLGFSYTLLQGLSIWLTGGIIFWFTELLTVIIGLPFSWDFNKLLLNGLSVKDAIKLTLLTETISIACLIYLLASFLGGVICSIIFHVTSKEKDEEKTKSVFISILLAFYLFIFGGTWLNIKYLPVLFSLKSIITNSVFLFVCIVLAQIFYKLFTAKASDKIFPNFVSFAFVINLFMMGEMLILKSFSINIFSVKGVLSGIALAAVSILVFFISKRISWEINFQFVRKWIFASSAALTLCAAVLLIVTSGSARNSSDKQGRDAAGKPNILFIVMDTTRADHLSCYGYKLNTSPNLDKIAGEGVLFRRVISPSSWTLPSHVSMFTGLSPIEHGIGYASPYLPEQIETLAGILKKESYRSLGYSNNPWVSFFTGMSRGFDDFQVGWKKHEGRYLYNVIYDRLIEILKRNDPEWSVEDHGAAKTTKYVSEWIEKDSKSPFFIFINYMEPHLPYKPPPPYDSLFMPDNISFEEIQRFAPNPEDIRTLMVPRQRSQKELSVISALYDGEINYLDGKIWRLYMQLKDSNILDNTLLIITSDHGDNLGDHGIVGHAYGLFNTLLEVPLIIRYPKYFKPGLTINDNVQATDIFYTIMEIAGIERNPSSLGLVKSLNRRIKEQDYQKIMIAEHDKPIDNLNWAKKEGINIDHLNKDRSAIIFNGYKYIQTSKGEEELYDLGNDPGEVKNIVSKSNKIASILRNKLNGTFAKVKPVAGSGQRPEIDKETKEKLRSLGYIR